MMDRSTRWKKYSDWLGPRVLNHWFLDWRVESLA
jgi:hypothetical protein